MPRKAATPRSKHQTCCDACHKCIMACEDCIASLMQHAADARCKECIKKCRECIALCRACHCVCACPTVHEQHKRVAMLSAKVYCLGAKAACDSCPHPASKPCGAACLSCANAC